MIFPRRDNRRRTRKVMTLVVTFLALGLLLLLLQVVNPQLFSPAAQAIHQPVAYSRNWFVRSFQLSFELVRSKQRLAADKSELRAELRGLQSAASERDFYKKEAERLAALVGRIPDPENYVLGNVLSKPGFSPYDTLILDVGSRNGIEPGDLVIAGDSVVIGTVREVFDRTLKVVLFSTAGQETVVFVGEARVETTAVGRGAGAFEFKVPRTVNIKSGDTVVAASYPDRPFGVIEEVKDVESESYEHILFRYPLNVYELSQVLVEKQ